MTVYTPSGGPVGTGITLTGVPLHLRPQPGGTAAVAVTVQGTPNYAQLLVGAGFEVRIYDVVNPNTLLAVVPNPETVQFEDTLSDVGSGQVTVATDDMNPAVFAKDHIWRIYWEGQERFAFIAEQIQDDSIMDDEVHRRTIAGRGLAQWLDKMQTYPTAMTAGVATRPFNNVSMASILQTLIGEAQTRGAGTFVTQDAWNANNDSEGVPWTDTNQLQVTAGTSLLNLTQQFGQAVTFDWHMTSRYALTLAKSLGQDRSATVRVQPVGSVESASVTADRTSLWDVVLLQDANNNFTEEFDTTAIATWSRRELFASSQTVVDAAGRADLGFQLVQQFKDQRYQRVVQISTSTVGRKPFVDFGLGDLISVEFTDGSIINSRVIAIAMAGGLDQATEECQVTLDFSFGQSQQAFSQDTALAYTGPAMVYADNGNNALTIGTSVAPYINVQLQAATPTSVTCDIYLRGQASTALTIEADLYLNNVLIRTMKQIMQAGEQTWSPTFVITSLPQGANNAQLRLSTSTGTFAVAPFDLQNWYEGQGLQGGIPSGSTLIEGIDIIPVSTIIPTVTTATPTLSRQTPSFSSMQSLVDSVPYSTNVNTVSDTSQLQRGYALLIATGPDDASNNTSPTFSNSATQLEAGNDGGIIWAASMRFVIPAPGIPVGATIRYARLNLVGDQADTGFTGIIYGEHAASPTAPTSVADFNGRTRTTANTLWTPPSIVVGTTYQSPDFIAIITELLTAFGAGLTAIQIFLQDNSSPLNGKFEFRSFENTNNQPPQLVVRWTV